MSDSISQQQDPNAPTEQQPTEVEQATIPVMLIKDPVKEDDIPVEKRGVYNARKYKPEDVIARRVKNLNFPNSNDLSFFKEIGDGLRLLTTTVREYNQAAVLYKEVYYNEKLVCTLVPSVVNRTNLTHNASLLDPVVNFEFANCIGPKPDDPCFIRLGNEDVRKTIGGIILQRKQVGGIILQYNADQKSIDMFADGLEVGEYILKISVSLDGAQRDFWLCLKVVETPLFDIAFSTPAMQDTVSLESVQ